MSFVGGGVSFPLALVTYGKRDEFEFIFSR